MCSVNETYFYFEGNRKGNEEKDKITVKMQSHCQAKLYPSMWTLCYVFHRVLTCVIQLIEICFRVGR